MPRFLNKRPEKKVFVEGMVLDHFPDASKPRSSYLPLLETAVEEDPMSDRMRYYLGREYLYGSRWQECIDTLKKHLELPAARWREERCASMRWIAKAYHELGNHAEACRWYYRAVAECPAMRDPYIECATMCYELGDWETVFYMTAEALKIKERSPRYVNMGYSWDCTPHDLAAIACYRLGLCERSREHAEQALALDPNNERLQKNLALIREKCPPSKNSQ